MFSLQSPNRAIHGDAKQTATRNWSPQVSTCQDARLLIQRRLFQILWQPELGVLNRLCVLPNRSDVGTPRMEWGRICVTFGAPLLPPCRVGRLQPAGVASRSWICLGEADAALVLALAEAAVRKARGESGHLLPLIWRGGLGR